MQKIIAHLWFDKEAKEAAQFYTSLFERSRIINSTVLRGTPSGDAETVSFELAGQPFMAISAGPYFKFNPSVSLMVACNSAEEVDTLWRELSPGGSTLMELGEYPFSKRYGWLEDRYGLSWQLMLVEAGTATQKITSHLLFSGEACGKTEEAINYYTDLFPQSAIQFISKYGPGEAQAAQAVINYAAFKLSNIAFSAADNGFPVDFDFNEAFSFVVLCEDQAEIDKYWDKLSAVPAAEQCGWLKDRFGLAWQIAPASMNAMLSEGSEEQVQRVTAAFLKMKKLDIAVIEHAYHGDAE